VQAVLVVQKLMVHKETIQYLVILHQLAEAQAGPAQEAPVVEVVLVAMVVARQQDKDMLEEKVPPQMV
jgi:hypothetical protein